MQKDKDKGHENLEEVPHPFDVNYGLLKTDLELLEASSDLYKVSYSVFAQICLLIKGRANSMKIIHIFGPICNTKRIVCHTLANPLPRWKRYIGLKFESTSV